MLGNASLTLLCITPGQEPDVSNRPAASASCRVSCAHGILWISEEMGLCPALLPCAPAAGQKMP